MSDKPLWKAREKGVYGCGRRTAIEVCRAGGIRPVRMTGMRTKAEVQRREQWVDDTREVGMDLKRKEATNRQRHRKRGTVRGIQLRRGLPVRRQRTQTNGSTARKLNKGRGA